MSADLHWYDRHGQPITVEQAEQLLANTDARRVALDRIGEHEVSTVHLVLDQRLGSSPVPLIFETMVFRATTDHEIDDCELCDMCERTPTEQAALAMHDQVCARVREEQHQRH